MIARFSRVLMEVDGKMELNEEEGAIKKTSTKSTET